jgi:hypothetical protein
MDEVRRWNLEEPAMKPKALESKRPRPTAAKGTRREIPIGFYPEDLEHLATIQDHVLDPPHRSMADAVRYALRIAASPYIHRAAKT